MKRLLLIFSLFCLLPILGFAQIERLDEAYGPAPYAKDPPTTMFGKGDMTLPMYGASSDGKLRVFDAGATAFSSSQDTTALAGYSFISTELVKTATTNYVYGFTTDNKFVVYDNEEQEIVEGFPKEVTMTCTDMAYDMTTGNLYGVRNGKIYEVDMTTGEITAVNSGTVGGNAWIAIAINKDGEMYAVQNKNNASATNLSKINTSKWTVTSKGSTGMKTKYAQSMTFDRNSGDLYWWHAGKGTGTSDGFNFCKVNTTNGATTVKWNNTDLEGTQLVGLYTDDIPYANWLTINYSGAGEATPGQYKKLIKIGDTYSVTSPTVDCYTPDKDVVEGTMGNEDVTVDVTYTVKEHTLTVVYQGPAGYTFPDTHTEQVNCGAPYHVETPEVEGFTPSTAVVEGTMPDEDVTVTVTYTINGYTLTINYTGAGEATPEAYVQTVEYNAPYSVATPVVDCYTPDQTVVEGTMPAHDVNVTVTYTINVHTLTITYVGAGDYTPDPVNEDINCGDSYEYETPYIGGFTADITVVEGTMPDEDVNETVTYTRNSYSIALGATVDGTIATIPESTALFEQEVNVIINEDPGFELATLTYTVEGEEPVDIMENQSFNMPAADVTVNATFAQTGVNTLAIEDQNRYYRDEITVPVLLENECEIAYAEMTILLGEQLTYVAGSAKLNTLRATDASWTLATEVIGTGADTKLHVIASNTNNAVFADNENKAIFSFKATAGIIDSDNEMKIENIVTKTVDGTVVTTTAVEPFGVIYVTSPDYTIAYGEIVHGTVEGPATSKAYLPVELTVEPAGCYHLATLTYTEEGSETPVAIENNTFTMPANNVTINATFEVNVHTLTINYVDQDGEQMDTPYSQPHNCGAEYNVVSPDHSPMYVVDKATVTGVMPDSDETVTVTYTLNQFNIAIGTHENGTLETSPAGTAIVGNEVTVTATPDACYSLATLTYTVEGGEPVAIVGGKFTMPAADVTVNATFTLNQHNLTITYTGAGDYTPDPVDEDINCGDSYEYETPYIGGFTADITVVSGTMPDEDVNETVTYTRNSYSIALGATVDGTIATIPESTALFEQEVNVIINEDPGFELATLTYTVEGEEPVDIMENQSFNMPAADVTVNATFAQTGVNTLAIEDQNKLYRDEITVPVLLENECNIAYAEMTILLGEQLTYVAGSAELNTLRATDASWTLATEVIGTGADTKLHVIASNTNNAVFADNADKSIFSINVTAGIVDSDNEMKIENIVTKTAEGTVVTTTAVEPFGVIYVTSPDYTIAYGEFVNGNVEGPATSKAYLPVELTVTPDECHHLATLTYTEEGSETPVTIENNTFTMPANNVTINATFEVNIHTLTVVYEGPEGFTFPETHIEQVNCGASYYVETPEVEGFTPSTAVVEGTMPDEDVTVTVTYTINGYTLTINYTGAGEATPEAYVQTVEYNAPYSVATPVVDCYTPDQTVVEGTMPAHDVTVDVVYTINVHTLTITYVGADEYTPAEIVEDVNCGASYEHATPVITGYTADIDVVSGTMPDEDVNVTVTYTVNNYSIAVVDPENGTLATTPAENADYRTTVEITATPDAGFGVQSITVVTDGGEPVEVVDNAFTMPADNVTVSAVYEQTGDNTLAIEDQNRYYRDNIAVPVLLNNANNIAYAEMYISLGELTFGSAELNALRAVDPTWTVSTQVVEGNKLHVIVENENNAVFEDNADKAIFTINVTADIHDSDNEMKIEGIVTKTAEGTEVTTTAVTPYGHIVVISPDYTITYAPMENGTVTGAATSKAYETVTLTVTPYECHHLTSLTYTEEGSETPVAIEGNTFEMPTHNVTINATFAINEHVLTVTYVGAGDETPAQVVQNVNCGAPYSVATPEVDCYTPDQTVVEGTMPDEDVNVTVTYTARVHTLTITYVGNKPGYAYPAQHIEEVNCGGVYEVASPHVEGFTPDIEVVTGVMPDNDVNVTVTYTINSHELTINYSGAGELTPVQYKRTFEYNTNYYVTSKDIDCYTADKLVVEGTMPDEDVTEEVTYTINVHTLTVTYVGAGDYTPEPAVMDVNCGEEYYVETPVLAGFTFDIEVVEGTMPDHDLSFTVTYTRSSYVIALGETVNGTIATIPESTALFEQEVNVIINEAPGFELATLTYTVEGEEPVDIKEDQSFYMPAADVTVNATFAQTGVNTLAIEDQNKLYRDEITVPVLLENECEIAYAEMYISLGELEYNSVSLNALRAVDPSWTIAAQVVEGNKLHVIASNTNNAVFADNIDKAIFSINVTAGFVDSDNEMEIEGIVTKTAEGTVVTTTAVEPFGVIYVTSPDYTIAYGEFVNGNVEGPATSKAYLPVELTVTPDECHHLATLTYTEEGSETPVAIENNTFTMPANNVTINATFEVNVHTLTVVYEGPEGFTFPETHIEQVNCGALYYVETPEVEGFTPSTAVVEGTMPDEDVTVTVTYTINGYTLTITYEGAGEATPVAYVETLEYNTPYSVATPVVDCYTPDQTVVEGTMPAHDVNVTVTYTINVHTLTITYVGADEFTPAEIVEDVNCGAYYEHATPVITGYTADIDVVSGTMPDEDVNVTVTYTVNNYSIAVVDPENGTLATTPAENADYRTTVEITATPDAGFGVQSITVVTDGGEPVEVVDNAFTMPADNVTVSAVYEQTGDNTLAIEDQNRYYRDNIAVPVLLNNANNIAYAEMYISLGELTFGSAELNALRAVDPTWTISAQVVEGNKLHVIVENENNAVFEDNIDKAIFTINVTAGTNDSDNEMKIEGIVTKTAEGTEVTTTAVTPYGVIYVTSPDYAIAYGEFVNGNVEGPATSKAYETVELTVTPDECHHLTSLTYTVEGEEPVAIEGNSFTMPANDVTINATFEVNVHTLTVVYEGPEGFTFPETHIEQVNCGAPYSVATPEVEGFTPSIAVVEGTMPDEDVNVTVTYTINGYTLTITYEGAGEATPEAYVQTLEYNTPYSVATPVVDCYTPDQTVVEGTMPAHDVNVTVTYTVRVHTLTITYVGNKPGYVYPAQYTEQVNCGDVYAVESPYVEGFTADPELVTDVMPDEDVNVTVHYTINKHLLTITYEGAGEDTPAPYTRELTYNTDYSVSSPVVSCHTADQAVVEGTMPDEDVNVTVTYTARVHTLTVTYVGAGIYTPEPAVLDVNCGEEYYVETPVIAGFTFDIAVVEGTMPDHDLSFTVTYTRSSYVIALGETVNGTIATEPAGAADYEQLVNVTVTPAVGFEVETLTYTVEGEEPVDIKEDQSFYMPAADVTVNATFVQTGVNTLAIEDQNRYYRDEIIVPVLLENACEIAYAEMYISLGELEYNSVSLNTLRAVDPSWTIAAQVVEGNKLHVIASNTNNAVFEDNIDKSIFSINVTAGIINSDNEMEIEGIVTKTAEGTEVTTTAVEPFGVIYVTSPDYTIAYGEFVNGNVEGPATSKAYETVELTVEPYECHHLTSLTYTVEGEEPVAIEGNTFEMPTHNVTINATFAINEHVLTVTYVGADEYTPAQVVENVNCGAPYYVETPVIPGYTADIDVVSGTMPDEDVTVTVTYSINSYTLTITYEGAGEATPVAYVETLEYNTPYSVATPVVDCYTPDQTVVEGTMPDHDVNVTVTYTINVHTLTVTYVGADEFTPAQVVENVNCGAPYYVETPVLPGFTADITVVEGTMPDEDVNVTVTYTRVDFNITVIDPENGTLATNPAEIGTFGNTIEIIATPDAGFGVQSITVVTDGGEQVEVVDNAFTMPADNVTVSAVYVQTGANTLAIEDQNRYYRDEITVPVLLNNANNIAYAEMYISLGELTYNSVSINPLRAVDPSWTLTAQVVEGNKLHVIVENENNAVFEDNADKAIFSINVTADIHDSDNEMKIEGIVTKTAEGTVVTTTAVEPFGVIYVTSPDYTIAYGEFVNGNVEGPATSKAYETVTLTVTPDECHHLTSLTYTVEGEEPVAIEGNTFEMPTHNVTINATFAINEHVLTVTYVGADEYTPAQVVENVNCGAPYYVETPVIPGYTADIDVVSGTMPDEDVNVTVTYSINSYTLTITYEGAGEATPVAYVETLEYNAPYSVATPVVDCYTPDQTVVEGTMPDHDVNVTVTYTINVHTLTVTYVGADEFTPAQVVENVNCGAPYYVETPYIAGYTADIDVVSGIMPDEDVNVTVTYGHDLYTITYAETANGMIDGQTAAYYQDEVEIYPYANEGYHFVEAHYTAAGTSTPVAIVNNVFTMPLANVTVDGTFEINTYDINAVAAPSYGGSVSGMGVYEHFSTATLVATPDPDYLFVNWTEGGQVVSTDAVYSFEVTGPRDLVANFAIKVYEINVSAHSTAGSAIAGGEVTGEGTYTIHEMVTVTATPATGFMFEFWMENGVIVSRDANYTFEALANRNLKAVFAINAYRIVARSEGEGEVRGSGTYNHGEEVTVTAAAAKDFEFEGWFVDDELVSEEQTYTFVAESDLEIVAHFRANTGIGETETVSAEVYPNPANDFVKVECQGMQRITIFSVLGVVVYDNSVVSENMTIDMSQFARGAYLMNIHTANGTVVKTIIVDR